MYSQMTLNTNLEHLTSAEQVKNTINSNENVVVVCGRMGPMCVPVYGIMESLRDSGKHENIKFHDMLFDNPEAGVIRSLPECQNFRGLPFTVYFKDGKVVKATSSIQEPKQVKDIIKEVF